MQSNDLPQRQLDQLTDSAPTQTSLPRLQVVGAIAILYDHDKYLMQLRDNIPEIIYPGQWALFGGHVEPNEPPELAVRRELAEEISHVPAQLKPFRRYEFKRDDRQVIRHVFHGALMVSLDQLRLNEGWDLGLLTRADILRGDRYADCAGEARPIATSHRQIMLDFWDYAAAQHLNLNS
jgi:8-oxo-dGTP diphosphatase